MKAFCDFGLRQIQVAGREKNRRDAREDKRRKAFIKLF